MSMAAMTIAIVVVFYGFSAAMRIFKDEMFDQKVSIEIQRAMEYITADLRGAQSIEAYSDTSIQVRSQDNSSDITYSWTGAPSRILFKTVNGAASQEVAMDVSDFSLTYDGTPVNKVNVRITGAEGTSISTLESTIKLRNL
jgi:hypothetical protein